MFRIVLIASLALAGVVFARAPEDQVQMEIPEAAGIATQQAESEPTEGHHHFEEASKPKVKASHLGNMMKGDDKVLENFMKNMDLDRLKEMNPELQQRIGQLTDMLKDKDIFKAIPEAMETLKNNPELKKNLISDIKAQQNPKKNKKSEEKPKSPMGGAGFDNLFGGPETGDFGDFGDLGDFNKLFGNLFKPKSGKTGDAGADVEDWSNFDWTEAFNNLFGEMKEEL